MVVLHWNKCERTHRGAQEQIESWLADPWSNGSLRARGANMKSRWIVSLILLAGSAHADSIRLPQACMTGSSPIAGGTAATLVPGTQRVARGDRFVAPWVMDFEGALRRGSTRIEFKAGAYNLIETDEQGRAVGLVSLASPGSNSNPAELTGEQAFLEARLPRSMRWTRHSGTIRGYPLPAGAQVFVAGQRVDQVIDLDRYPSYRDDEGRAANSLAAAMRVRYLRGLARLESGEQVELVPYLRTEDFLAPAARTSGPGSPEDFVASRVTRPLDPAKPFTSQLCVRATAEGEDDPEFDELRGGPVPASCPNDLKTVNFMNDRVMTEPTFAGPGLYVDRRCFVGSGSGRDLRIHREKYCTVYLRMDPSQIQVKRGKRTQVTPDGSAPKEVQLYPMGAMKFSEWVQTRLNGLRLFAIEGLQFSGARDLTIENNDIRLGRTMVFEPGSRAVKNLVIRGNRFSHQLPEIFWSDIKINRYRLQGYLRTGQAIVSLIRNPSGFMPGPAGAIARNSSAIHVSASGSCVEVSGNRFDNIYNGVALWGSDPGLVSNEPEEQEEEDGVDGNADGSEMTVVSAVANEINPDRLPRSPHWILANHSVAIRGNRFNRVMNDSIRMTGFDRVSIERNRLQNALLGVVHLKGSSVYLNQPDVTLGFNVFDLNRDLDARVAYLKGASAPLLPNGSCPQGSVIEGDQCIAREKIGSSGNGLHCTHSSQPECGRWAAFYHNTVIARNGTETRIAYSPPPSRADLNVTDGLRITRSYNNLIVQLNPAQSVYELGTVSRFGTNAVGAGNFAVRAKATSPSSASSPIRAIWARLRPEREVNEYRIKGYLLPGFSGSQLEDPVTTVLEAGFGTFTSLLSPLPGVSYRARRLDPVLLGIDARGFCDLQIGDQACSATQLEKGSVFYELPTPGSLGTDGSLSLSFEEYARLGWLAAGHPSIDLGEGSGRLIPGACQPTIGCP